MISMSSSWTHFGHLVISKSQNFLRASPWGNLPGLLGVRNRFPNTALILVENRYNTLPTSLHVDKCTRIEWLHIVADLSSMLWFGEVGESLRRAPRLQWKINQTPPWIVFFAGASPNLPVKVTWKSWKKEMMSNKDAKGQGQKARGRIEFDKNDNKVRQCSVLSSVTQKSLQILYFQVQEVQNPQFATIDHGPL